VRRAGPGSVLATHETEPDKAEPEVVRISFTTRRVAAHLPCNSRANRVNTAFSAGEVG
jgi:hypothetical protein